MKYKIKKSARNIEFASLFSRFYFLDSASRGVATLPTVILLGVMSLVVAVGIATLSFTELMISQGGSQSSRALFYAESGARDALMRIARDKTYTCSSADCYLIDFSTNGCTLGNDCAKVSVSAGSPKIVTSKGIMKASTRTMQVSVSVDGNGQIATSSTQTVWSEIY
ncbi:MAG: hypothetical protein HZB12_01670 [Candidatus Yonathbacteria bacterium]|nr:hypothetical protein [Candidatus Yonathbacteria bacterium]